MMTNEQIATLRDHGYTIILGPRGAGRWEYLRRINRKFCDIDQQRKFDELQEDLRRAYERGEYINVEILNDRG